MWITLLHTHDLSRRRVRTLAQRLWWAAVTLAALVLLCTSGQPAQGNTPAQMQGALDPDVVLAVTPAQTTVTLGARVTVTVWVHTTQQVDGAAAHLIFDPAVLQVASATVGDVLPVLLQNQLDNQTGRISLASGALDAPFPGADFVMASIVFTATGVTDGTPLGFAATRPLLSDVTYGGRSILDWREPATITVLSNTPTATPTGTPTATPVGGNTATSTPTITGTPPTSTPTQIGAPTATQVGAPTPTMTPTITGTPPTPTPTQEGAPTSTPSPTPTPGQDATPTPTVTVAPTATSTATSTATPPQLRLLRLEPNQGLNTTPNEVVIVGAGLRPDTTITVGGAPVKNYHLSNGGEASAVVSPGLTPGSYGVTAANPGGGSFTLAQGYTVIDGSQQDLAVTDLDLWFEPATVRQSAAISVGVNVHRSGGATTLPGVVVAFYLDALAPGAQLGVAMTPPLDAGTDAVEAAALTWTPATAGRHTLYAVVDPDNDIAEGSEANNTAQWEVTVLPVEEASDTTPPTIAQLVIDGGVQVTTAPTVTVALTATDVGGEVRAMYFVERTYNNAARLWTPRQQSGWIDFRPAFSVTLSATGGARYLQAWVADDAGNISTSSQRALINYLPAQETVLEGQVRLYRLWLASGEQALAVLTPSSGDPDLYVWAEDGVLAGYSNLAGTAVDSVQFVAPVAGLYQFEVHGYVESNYFLVLTTGAAAASVTPGAVSSKSVPTTPVVAPASTPPGQQALPTAPRAVGWQLFLPVTVRS